MKRLAAVLSCLFVLAVLGLPAMARADDDAPSSPVVDSVRFASTVDAAVSGNVAVLSGDVCERNGDVVDCISPLFLAGVQAEAHYRFPSAWFALGLVGGAGFSLDQSQSCSESGCVDDLGPVHWRLAVEPRFYPLRARAAELFLALEAGLFGLSEDGATAVGFGFGAALGMDIALGDHFYLGGELRLLLHVLPGQEPSEPADNGRTELPFGVAPSLGLLKLGWRFAV